jgi:hypothetical protein
MISEQLYGHAREKRRIGFDKTQSALQRLATKVTEDTLKESGIL